MKITEMNSIEYVLESRHETFVIDNTEERLSDQIDNFKQEESRVRIVGDYDVLDDC